jgi:hypothetical protein
MKKLKELIDSYNEFIDGVFLLDSGGILIEGYLPDGWTEEDLYFGISPIINILKNITKGYFIDISETQDFTMIITSPDREVFIGVIGDKKRAPLGYLLTILQEIYTTYIQEKGIKEHSIEEIVEKWSKSLS